MRAASVLCLLVCLLHPSQTDACFGRTTTFMEQIGQAGAVIVGDVVSSTPVLLEHSHRTHGIEHKVCNVEVMADDLGLELDDGCLLLVEPLSRGIILSTDDSLAHLYSGSRYLLYLFAHTPFGLPNVTSHWGAFRSVTANKQTCAVNGYGVLTAFKDLKMSFNRVDGYHQESFNCTLSFEDFVAEVRSHVPEARRLHGPTTNSFELSRHSFIK